MKTKSYLAFVVCFAFKLLLLSGLHARPVDLSVPPGGLGPTSNQGFALHWMELTEVDFGGGLALPLRFSFLSGRPGESQDFGGAGWRTPLFTSRLLPKTDADWPVLLPCGKIIHLHPQAADAKAWGTADGEWLAKARGANTIVGREDGWEMEFDKRGLLIRLRTDAGRNVLWSRDAKGGLIALSELAGGKITATGLTVQRDAAGLVAAMEVRTAFGVKTWKLGYDAAKRLERVTFPDGRTERCAYDTGTRGQPRITITNRALIKTSLTWDKENFTLLSDGLWTYNIQPQKGTGPLMTRTGPGGEFESYQDDEATGRVVFTAADGTTTTRQKVTAPGPAKGKLETITRTTPVAAEGTRRANPASQPLTTYRATYGANGMLAEETDALGRKTTHQYLLFGASPQSGVSKHTQTDPLGHATIEEFDRHGNLIAETDALGNVTRREYDAQNRRVKTIGPDGTPTETLAYTPQGMIASRTDAAGNTIHYGYDQNGNVASITDALGGITRTDFDLQGNKISATDALGRVWKFENDAGGRLLRTFAPGGVETERRAYDEQGRVIAVTDAAGNTSRTAYDAFDRVTSRTDALDRVTKFSYDVKKGATGCTACNASAMPTRITMPGGRTIERTYDADRRLVEERRNGGPGSTGLQPVRPAAIRAADSAPVAITRHAYDLAGNLTSTTNPLGHTTKFEYDLANNRIKTIHPDNTTRVATFDPAGRVVAEIDETGAATKRAYDAHGNIVSITDAAGGTSTLLYEAPGAAAGHRSTGAISAAGVRADIAYDALWRRIAEIKGAPNRAAALAALAAEKTEARNPKSEIAITRHEFDAVGNEIRGMSPTGKMTTHQYDTRNRRIVTAEPLGRVWKFIYADNAGPTGPAPCCGGDPGSNSKAVETILPDGAKESRIVDAAGQLIKTTDAKGDSIAYTYDPDGRLETLTDAKGNITRWQYDAHGKLAAKIYPDRTMEQYEHDAAGRMIRRIRADGTAALHAYDVRGKLTGITWDGDRAEPSTFAYDAAGRMTLAKNLTATVERKYTPAGRLETETQTITPSFDPNPESQISNLKSTIAYRHDADGRLAALVYPDRTEIRYTYNTRGELAEVADYNVAAEGTRRANHPPLAAYDRRPDGSIAKLTMANGLATTRTYDEAGRLTEIKHTAPNGEVLESEASRYDVRDRRTARIRGDGTADLFAYDPASQVVAAAYGAASGTDLQSVRPAGVPTADSKTTNPTPAQSGTEKDGFTPTQTFAYDAAGNRLKTTDSGRVTAYVANANNQYTAISEDGAQHEPDYDKSGNLLHDATRKFTWDADIHLLAVETKEGGTRRSARVSADGRQKAEGGEPQSAIPNPKSAIKESFRYDALHRRVARNESATGTTTLFVHDGWNVVAEFEQSGPALQRAATSSTENAPASQAADAQGLKPGTTFLAARHVWGEDLSRTLQGAGGIRGLLASTHFGAQAASPITSLFFSYDSNGNVTLLTDALSRIAANYRYDAFGQTITATGPAANLNRYRFSTKPVELASGLAYFGYRYYDPWTGRWPSRDPIRERGGINLYAMVANDVMNGVDILGWEGWSGTVYRTKTQVTTEHEEKVWSCSFSIPWGIEISYSWVPAGSVEGVWQDTPEGFALPTGCNWTSDPVEGPSVTTFSEWHYDTMWELRNRGKFIQIDWSRTYYCDHDLIGPM